MNIVLYHDNCLDGFTAAWAAWRSFGDQATYRAVQYGQEPPIPDVVGRDVYLVDFCYPRTSLDAIVDVAHSVTLFDHHKTAQTDLAGWARGHVVFDMERSGAGITWDELHTDKRPTLVSYVEDRDLWRWMLPESREVSEYLFSLLRTFTMWDQAALAMESDFPSIVDAGRALRRAKVIRVASVCENVRWVVLSGHHIPVVNAAWDFSEVGEYLCQKFSEAVCAGYYFDRADRRQWGFRSRSGFDVSKLCKIYGGGGHAAAAGFTSEIGWLPA